MKYKCIKPLDEMYKKISKQSSSYFKRNKTAQFYSEAQTEQKYELAADADIYMMKFWCL